MAKKKAEDMREQLKQIISFSRGPSAWEELLRTEADIRKKRQKMIYDQEERRRKLVEGILIAILVLIVGSAILGFAWLFATTRGFI
jgi:beta-lactamase regulating signal transducer with metallopeptidase domain